MSIFSPSDFAEMKLEMGRDDLTYAEYREIRQAQYDADHVARKEEKPIKFSYEYNSAVDLVVEGTESAALSDLDSHTELELEPLEPETFEMENEPMNEPMNEQRPARSGQAEPTANKSEDFEKAEIRSTTGPAKQNRYG